jgi:translation initiation factor 5A
MSDYEEEEFENTNIDQEAFPGAFPITVSKDELKVGTHIILKNFPCRIIELDFVKTGKHGSSKAIVVGLDIFTSKKYEGSFAGGKSVFSFKPEKTQYQLNDIDEDSNSVSLMDDKGSIKEDLNLPDNETLKDKLVSSFNSDESILVTVLSAVGKQQISDFRKE